MKKFFIVLISIILICLTVLGVIGCFVEQSEAESNSQVLSGQNEKLSEWKILDTATLDINKIEGYKPGGVMVPSKTSKEDEEDLEQENKMVTEVGGLELPFTPPYRQMEIVSIGGYTGQLLDDTSDNKKENVLSMIIKNTSDKVIDYGEIIIKIKGQNKGLSFKFSDLKPGAAALVLESSKEVQFSEDDKYVYLDSRAEFVDEMDMMKEEINITTEDNKITVENISDKNLNTVYVYYKTVSPGGCYLGGTTYRAKFVNLTKSKVETIDTLHFDKENSEIIKVESVKE